MNVAFKLPPPMTVDEFLQWPGDGTGTRYELVDGALRAQDPASYAHGTIHANISFAITGHLRATRPGCRVVAEPGVQPRIRANWNYLEGRVASLCGELAGLVHGQPLFAMPAQSQSQAAAGRANRVELSTTRKWWVPRLEPVRTKCANRQLVANRSGHP